MLTVNLSGAPPTDAINSELFPAPAKKVPFFFDSELDLIEKRLDAEQGKSKPSAKGAAKKSSKKAASPKSSVQAKGKEWDKSPLNPARFKKGSKVVVTIKGVRTESRVVGVSPDDNRKLRVAVGNKTHDFFVAQLPVGKGNDANAAPKKTTKGKK
jgi:hypothetical protein